MGSHLPAKSSHKNNRKPQMALNKTKSANFKRQSGFRPNSKVNKGKKPHWSKENKGPVRQGRNRQGPSTSVQGTRQNFHLKKQGSQYGNRQAKFPRSGKMSYKTQNYEKDEEMIYYQRFPDSEPLLPNVLKTAERDRSKMERGAVYIGRLPFGFYEKALRKFFQQFGKITRIKVARSDKTANPKGWAFVEFEFKSVAKIAAETMNNYFLFNRVLKCDYISPGNIKSGMFYPEDVHRSTCKLTQSRIRNQEEMRQPRIKRLVRKSKKKKIEHAIKLLENTFGIDGVAKAVKRQPKAKKRSVPDSESGKGSGKKRKRASNRETLTMEMSGTDNEISVKTPPNVIKKIRAEPADTTDTDTTKRKKRKVSQSISPIPVKSLKVIDKEISSLQSEKKGKKRLLNKSKRKKVSTIKSTNKKGIKSKSKQTNRKKKVSVG